MAKATWHQNYVDQALGPNVGRVVNDKSVANFSGEETPEDGSQQIEDAFGLALLFFWCCWGFFWRRTPRAGGSTSPATLVTA